MPETHRRAQLVLEWTDAVQWNDLPSEAREELRRVLCELLRQADHGDGRAEGASDE